MRPTIVYKEIFEDQCYLKHGIRLQDGDYGRGYRRQYRALFVVRDEPLQKPEDLRLRTGAGRVRAAEGKLRGLWIECPGLERRRVGQAQDRDVHLL